MYTPLGSGLRWAYGSGLRWDVEGRGLASGGDSPVGWRGVCHEGSGLGGREMWGDPELLGVVLESLSGVWFCSCGRGAVLGIRRVDLLMVGFIVLRRGRFGAGNSYGPRMDGALRRGCLWEAGHCNNAAYRKGQS